MVKLPDGLKIEKLRENYNQANTMFQPAQRRMRMLDATDRGKLWTAINAKFPKYQVLPDTNHVAYVKSNLVASLYSVGRSASLMPTTDEDQEVVGNLNILLDHIWDTEKISYYQMLAGERAALLNLGVTQVGWDNNIVLGQRNKTTKGDIALQNIDPMKYLRDPYADDLDTSAYVITFDTFHKNVILANKKYREEFQKYLDQEQTKSSISHDNVDKVTDQKAKPNLDYYKLVSHWVMHDDALYEIQTVNNEYVLSSKSIKPAVYPFAELFCNIPSGDLIGTSEPSKIFANSVAYNLMNSIILTSEVKNQKPPKFINGESGINVSDFIRHGSDSDYTFIVRGDASKAVHYHEFPTVSPIIQNIMMGLSLDVQQISGVDGKYTGKDTGSILTTGGVEQMLDQATLIDQPKIVSYEMYTQRLTQLILGNLKEYGKKRQYFVKNPETREVGTIEVNFDKLKDDTVFHYAVNISAHLPKNKQRIAQMANVIMEKQMQYNQEGQQQVELMTAEEWLSMQDFPMQEKMQERMNIARSKDYVDQVAKTLFQYSDMLEQGLDPSDALLATADALQTGEQSPLVTNQPLPQNMEQPAMDMAPQPQQPQPMQEDPMMDPNIL